MLKKMFAIALVLGIATVAGVSFADTDNAPGSMCVATGSNTMSINTVGHGYNNNTSSMTVVCPSERKIIGSNFATKFKGTVWVMDRSTTDNVCCRAMTRNPGGANVTGTEVCTSGSSSSYKQLNVPQITDNYTWSHFYIRCTLPAKDGSNASRILTYRSVQN